MRAVVDLSLPFQRGRFWWYRVFRYNQIGLTAKHAFRAQALAALGDTVVEMAVQKFQALLGLVV